MKGFRMKDVLGYEGRTVVVTGAASGMGAATARVLRELGAQVIGIDVQHIADSVHTSLKVDLRDKASIEAGAAAIDGPIDGFFGCAGLPAGPFPNLDVMLVNFVGARHLVELLVPKMTEGSAIAVVASNGAIGWQLQLEQLLELVNADGFDAGKKWCEQHSELEAYSTSKKVINAWVAARGATLITQGIRINCTNPGPTSTAMMPHFVASAGQETIDAYVGPVARLSSAEEQAWPLVFLNSPRASFINGESFTVDGGFFGAVQTGQMDLSKLAAAAGA
jgi:NAD(P)-dependent dehydrogenase (short-subunit alcohol dehydrogenase family)